MGMFFGFLFFDIIYKYEEKNNLYNFSGGDYWRGLLAF